MVKIATLLSLILAAPLSFAELVLYTDRSPDAIAPIVAEFEKRTGESVVIVSMGYKEIRERLELEGANSPADLVFTKDLVYLSELERMGVFQPMSSPEVVNAVEPYMQSPEKNWTAITFRARTVVYSPVTVMPGEITSYADLAQPQWQGRLCVRVSSSSYNVGLLGFFIETMGYDNAKDMLAGWMNNLAQEPFPNDTSILEAIANGLCDVGVVNSYYLGLKKRDNLAFPVDILFANQDQGGVHTNGTGMGVLKTSDTPELAEQFVALMLEEGSQLHLSGGHMDYPARKGLMPNTLVAEWGEFLKAPVNWSVIGDRANEALQLADEVGY